MRRMLRFLSTVPDGDSSMTREVVQKLLAEGESNYLDWKCDFPRELIADKEKGLWDKGRAKLLKSLVSLANSSGSEQAYLVYGVKDLRAKREVMGKSLSFDDADFQQWAKNTFNPPPTFLYTEIEWDVSKTVGLFLIERTSDYPHVVKADLGGVIHKGQVWFRSGSKSEIALHGDLQRMFQGDTPFKIPKLNNSTLKQVQEHHWKKGYQVACCSFDKRDSLLEQGYQLATFPGTRREIWVGCTASGRYEHILLLKPRARPNSDGLGLKSDCD